MPQNPLTPGLGFVDEDSESQAEVNSPSSVGERLVFANGQGLQQPNAHHDFTESEEIWEELEDDKLSEVPPQQRKLSAHPLPSPNLSFTDNSMDNGPDESTALLSRARTGRFYRDKGRRRSTQLNDSGDHGGKWRSSFPKKSSGGWRKIKDWWQRKDRNDGYRGDNDGNGHEAY